MGGVAPPAVPLRRAGAGREGGGRYVVSHPEGERCLVIASKGNTVSRRRNGSVLHRFPSLLPNGSRATGGSSDQYCILDAVFHEVGVPISSRPAPRRAAALVIVLREGSPSTAVVRRPERSSAEHAAARSEGVLGVAQCSAWSVPCCLS